MTGERQKKRKRRSSRINHKTVGSGKSKRKVQSLNRPKQISNVKILAMSFITIFSMFSIVILVTTSFGKMLGYSMLPEVENNDIFTVDKVSNLRRFDLVYIKVPNRPGQKTVRRIIGMPGDELFYKNDELFVNNEGKSERYLSQRKNQLSGGILTEDFDLMTLTKELKVPEKKYFVMGDNRQSSADSRDYGFVAVSQIIGKVEMKIFPFSYLKSYR